MPTRTRTGYHGHGSGLRSEPLDFPAPVTHQSGLFPALPRGSVDNLGAWTRGRTSPVRRKPVGHWHTPIHGRGVYPSTEMMETIVPVAPSPVTPVHDTTNDHLKSRLELIEAQMDMLRNTQDDTLASYNKSRLHESQESIHHVHTSSQNNQSTQHELDALKKELAAKQRSIAELTAQLEEAKQLASEHQANASTNDDIVTELKAKLTEERKTLDELRQRHKEMLSSALDDINAANQKLADQEEKIDAYKAQLASEQAQLANEQKRADGLERERDSLRARASQEAALNDDLAKANEDLRKAKKTVYDLQEALDKAERAAADQERMRRKGDHLAETVERLEIELMRAKQEGTAKDDELRKIRSELQAAIRAEADASNEVELMKERTKNELMNANRKADQNADDRTRMLEEEVKRLRGETQKLESRRLEGEEDKRRGVEDELRRLRADLQRSEARRLETEETKRVAQQKLEEAEDALLRLKRAGDRLKDLDSMHTEATGKVYDLEKANRSLFDQLETCKYECQREREQGANWKTELERLRTEMARVKSECESIKTDAETRKIENNRLAATATKLKEENMELLEESQKVKGHAERTRIDNEHLKKDNDHLIKDNDHLKKDNERLMLEAEAGKKELERLNSELSKANSGINKNKSEIDALTRVKVEVEAELDRLHNELSKNRSELDALTRAKLEAEAGKKEIDRLNSELSKNRSEIDALTRTKLEAEAARSELERLSSEVSKNKSELDVLRHENVDLRSDANRYKHQSDVLQADLDRLKQQLRNAANHPMMPNQPAPAHPVVPPPPQQSPSQPPSPSNVLSNHIILPHTQVPQQLPVQPSQMHHHTLMLSGEEEIMRIGSELRKALRVRDDALSELESLAKQLSKSKRQHELTQQELETSEAKMQSTRRQADELKEELESTIAQLTRARTTAQDALAEAEASGRMLNEARRIADEARDRLQQETQRFQRESEAAEQAWNEAIAVSDEERAELQRKLESEEERCITLNEKLEEFQRHSDDLSRQLDHMQDVLKAEGEIADKRLRAQHQQLTDAHNEKLYCADAKHQREMEQLKAAHKEELHEAIKEVSEMKDMLSTSVQEKSEMQSSFEQQLDNACRNLRDANTENAHLREDVARATEERDSIADELMATQLALAKIQDHSTLKEKEGNDLVVRLTDAEERHRMERTMMEQEVMKLRAEAEAQLLAERGHAEALTEVHKCYEEVSCEAKQLREMLETSNDENEQASHVIRESQDKVASLREQLQVVMKSKEEVTERLVGAENTIADMQKDIMRAVEKYEEKKNELSEATYNLESRNAELEALSVKYLSTSSELAETKQQHNSLITELKRLQAEAEALKQGLVQASFEADEAKHSRASDRIEVNRMRQLEERALAELEEANHRLTESLAQETALRKELRACQDKIARHDMIYETLEGKLNQEVQMNEQLARDHEAAVGNLNETVRKLRIDLDRSHADLEALALKEETATRRLQDAHRLHESKEKALQEDIMTERHTRAELEEQLSNARKQYRQARREVTLSSEEAEKAREEAEEHAQQRLRKYKQDLEDVAREKERLEDAEAVLKAELHKYFLNEEATFRHLYSTKEELHRLDLVTSFERMSADRALASHLQFAANNEKDLKMALDSQALELLQKDEELSHVYAQLEESKNNSMQAKLSNDALSQQIKLLQTDQGEIDQLVKKYEDRVAECNSLKGEVHASRNTLQEMTAELNRNTQRFDAREQELMRVNGDLEAANLQKMQEVDALKQEVLRLQREWNHSSTGLDSERNVVQTLRDELEICRRELQNTKDRLSSEIRSIDSISQQSLESERRRYEALKEDMAGLQEAHQKMAVRCTLLTALAEAIVSERPAEGIGRLTWRVNMEAEQQLGVLLGSACEHMSRLYQLEEGARSLSAGFDFICATRETLVRELGACKKAVFDAFQESSRLMEEMLRSGSENKGSRDSCGKLCASLGGLRSQLIWLVTNCMSQEERGLAGIHSDDDVSGTIKHLRKTTLVPDMHPVTPETRPVSAPLNSAMKKFVHRPVSPDTRMLVSPVPSRSSDTDLHSCYGSDDGRSLSQPPTTPRTAAVLPKTTPKKARVIAPEDVVVMSPRR